MRWGALLLVASLTGCNLVTEDKAREIASDYATDTSALESRIDTLEGEVERLKSANADLNNQLNESKQTQDGLRRTVNGNAEAFNNLLRRLNM